MATYTGTPRTWTAGETVTAALMNSDVRDPLAALSGAWNSYTPTLAGFTPGNGTATGAYIQVGKLVIFRALFTFGTTSAAASAIPSLTLPVTAATTGGQPLGAFFGDSSASSSYLASGGVSTTTTASVAIIGASGLRTACSTTTPFTWATGDTISVAGVYEAA